ncbi:hypothetical protein [Pseudomonas sp. NFR16]|uniref:hypothetical protein n=1 Tax=Pseudomonas sp. NFR16 TaxID=1566248 RepID=UPI0008D89B19|nr:hypothetical protein [Pseudomonas sp. NFR16]SEJ88750.1 Na+-driven multidrug efflux pump [Pseudomonas sp. NFR16]
MKLNHSSIIKKSLPAFFGARLAPMLGASAAFLLVAHKSPDDLSLFAYVLAVMSVVSTCCSLLFATTGNKAAELRGDKPALENFFSGGFTLASLVAFLAFLVCTAAAYLLDETESIKNLNTNAFWNLSLIYSFSIPLLIVNFFLQLFLEATGKAAICANRKIVITAAGFSGLIIGSLYVDSAAFTYYAMSYFFVAELLATLAFTNLIRHQRYLCFSHAKRLISYFVRFGTPIAVGMTGQKLYFYLLSERLLGIDIQLVAQLSICMTLIGLLMIPSLALSQIHSLQISQHPENSRDYFLRSLWWVIGLMALSAALLAPSAKYLFILFGGSLISYNENLLHTLIAFLTCSSLLSLAVAHLRARNETLGPQLLISFLMLALLIPGLYLFPFLNPGIEIFLGLQSATAFTGFLLLCSRIYLIHRRDQNGRIDAA